MKDTNDQDTRTIKWRLAAIVISIGLLLVGCDPYLPGKEKSWTVGNCEIHEEIQRSKSNWPDARYLRRYRLERDGRTLTVGRYENESGDGVIHKPHAVGDDIVILTSSYVFRVRPDDQVNEFSPWDADQWLSFSEPLGINGHYDYYVETVENVAGVWRLTYALRSGPNGKHPERITFTTTDDWQSFQMENEGLKP